MDTQYGGSMILCRWPKLHSAGKFLTHPGWEVQPHHSHLMPDRHSADQQALLQAWHFELLGRFPSLQWWYWTTLLFPLESGTKVAHSLQFATEKSWHSMWTQYSQTSHRTAFASGSILLRQTEQNFLFICMVSVQQWGTGFLITLEATVEQGDTTVLRHRSWTTKLQTSQIHPCPMSPQSISVQWWQYVGLWKVFLLKKCPCPCWSYSVVTFDPEGGVSAVGLPICCACDEDDVCCSLPPPVTVDERIDPWFIDFMGIKDWRRQHQDKIQVFLFVPSNPCIVQ